MTRSFVSRSMCRPVYTVRQITADRWTPGRRLALDWRFILLILALLSQTKSTNISSTERITSEFRNNNNDEKTTSLFMNEINLNNNDDHDDFYIGYSGYLLSTSSLLALRTKYRNFTNNDILSERNQTVFETLKSNGNRRFKRAVTHLYNMILCATGCNPLLYKGYGCYCGFLGSGYPMDGIDRCCKMHDWCYDTSECPMFVEYFVPYYWKCYHGYKPICAIEHGAWGSSGSCAQRLCECDRTFAECLRRYRCPRHKAVCTSSPWRLIQNLFMII